MRVERQHYCRRCAGTLGAADGPQPFVLPGARPRYAPDRVCDVQHVKIEVGLDFAARRVDGVCTQRLAPLNDGPCRLTLDAVEMEIHAVLLGDGQPLEHTYDGRQLTVDLGARSQGEAIELVVRYGATPRRGLYFLAPDETDPRRPVQAWTQGQDEDNRHWFPCFDHPHEKATSEVIATVPEQMTVLSNGVLAGERHDAERRTRTFHFRHEVEHASYLVTLVAGEFTIQTDRAGEVELFYYVPRGREEDAPRTFGRTPEMVRLFAELTGRAYPYPRYSQVAVADFIFGGMENTTATTLTDQTLHDARAHLDYSSEPLVAHELAHQWFGDLLTCRDWGEGWLNEGFATYFEILWKEHAAGRDEADYDRLADAEAYLDEDARRYRRPIVTRVFHEPIDVFDRHLYEKGAAVLHMLRHELGDALFWKAVRGYVARHQGGSVETRDLVRAIEAATGRNADRFFQQWVLSAGFPALETEYAWDEEARLARLTVKQTQKAEGETPLFALPLTVRFVVGGETIDRRLDVEAAAETFVFALPGRPEQVIVDPGNHYLKTLEEKKPPAEWKAQLARAALGIDRVRAARALGKLGEPGHAAALAEALRRDPFWAVRGEAALALGELRTPAARDAIVAALPEEAHPKARRLMVRALGAFRHDAAAGEAVARVLDGDASYFVEAEAALALARLRAAGAVARLRRAMDRPSFLDVIRAQSLAGLAELRAEEGIELALEALRPGNHPGGRRAAAAALGTLGALYHGQRPRVREELIDRLDDHDFRIRYAAVEALAALGDVAAAGALHRAAERDLDGRVRRRAREAARSLGRGAAQDEALRGLRDAIEKLEGENRDLKDRLARLEAKGSQP